MKRCMIYACNHAWSRPMPGLAYSCKRCDDEWWPEFCAHDPKVKGCECAR